MIARISLKPRRTQGFLAEELIGDFRYKLKGKKHRAKFIKGLYAGDRVIVRLFTPDNRFIGYSEFELLSSNTAVTLVLPERPSAYGIVRTIYGADLNEDYGIDRSAQIYDYYTQVSQVQNYQEARVTFLETVQTSLVNLFNVSGLPNPRPTCSYPNSFRTGSFTLVNQIIRVFSSNLTPALVSFPGQVVQVNNVSTTNISTYEVRQQIVNYQRIGATPGTIVYTSDDGWDDDRKPRKRNCNQGIGNGSEGCDPGNSHPHGGSNDEGGRSLGGRGKR
ncbi:hypothetical protein K9N68_14325 [Kovacikia minuta CCNUW1]|uniref:hypothetical protein n=1 Tax=Kovacikia minuta TaxID=2931930 RepID=UPI001CCF2025|nr:hypothetical protein [Kovacikia minuta]UBF28907.1 hypothetical protein K9N68_14325 [Kovacikia minuta CCNUW1]